MDTYRITSELAGCSRKRQVVRGFVTGGLFALLMMISDVLWPSWSSGGALAAVISGRAFRVSLRRARQAKSQLQTGCLR
jgi:hypothetical protein